MPQSLLDKTHTLTPAELRSVENLYRSFRNPDLLDESCTEDWQDTPLAPGQGPGPAGLKAIIPNFLNAFPDLEFVIHEIIGSSARAGVRATLVGTHLGTFHGIPATGQRVEIAIHEFHHLREGRVSHTWHLEDWFGMLGQIGAWPPNSPRSNLQ